MNDRERTEFSVPILFLMFNRPDHAKQVMSRIRLIRPTKLFVAVDGPRENRSDDFSNVQQCIGLIDEIDWPCTVEKLIRERNLGCKRAVSSAIDWFFNYVEEGIILEDDCVPDISFFDFCRVLLNKFRDEKKVMHIGGANIYQKQVWSEETYFFSHIAHIWGWATWRRAWKHYDVKMQDYNQFRSSNALNKIVTNVKSKRYWKHVFDATHSGLIDTWDYQWVYAVWKNNGLSVIPNYNMISNVGFDGTGTHTLLDSKMSELPTFNVNSNEIIHPEELRINTPALEYALAELYEQPSWWKIKIDNLKSKLNWK